MSGPTAIPLPIVQMGHVEKLAEVAQNHPEVQQSVAQQLAKSALQKQKTLVPQVDTTEQGKRVREREAQRDKRQSRRERKAGGKTDEDAGDAQEARSSDDNPWAGHILNLKI